MKKEAFFKKITTRRGPKIAFFIFLMVVIVAVLSGDLLPSGSFYPVFLLILFLAIVIIIDLFLT